MTEFIDRASDIRDFLKNFANKDKLAILCYFWDEEKNVSDILNHCHISQSQLSQFLTKMKLEWILSSEKRWKEVYYKISDKNVSELISSLKNIFNK